MKKLFTNDRFFLATVLIATLGTIFTSVVFFKYQSNNYVIIFTDLLRIVCVNCLYISYKKHNKNVMKGMMGALLMQMLIHSIQYSAYNYSETASGTIINLAYVIVSIILFANHFFINSEHKSNPIQIGFNQVLIALILIAEIYYSVLGFGNFTSTAEKVNEVVYAVAFAFSMAAVICVESRLDTYRSDREKAGWSEEKGYPEGYVHEYEKK